MAVAGLCALTILVFLPLRHAQFLQYDDDIYVTQNPQTLAGLTWKGVLWALGNADFNWHPLTWISHMLDCQLFGLDAGAHHMTSVLIHCLNAALLLYVLLRLTGAMGRSLAVAALFAVHPLHVESVAWVSERKDLLSAFFWLAAILAYVRFVERRTPARYLAVCACLVLSLLAKGMAITMPFQLLLLDYWPLRRWPADGCSPGAARESAWRALVWEKVPLLCLSAMGAAATVVGQIMSMSIATADVLPLPLRVWNSLASYAAYVEKMFLPVGLAIPYPFRPGFLSRPRVLLSVLFLAAVSVLVVRLGRTRRYLVTGWLWYLVTLLPVVGLVQIGHQAMADRYTYVPLIGLFVMVAWGAVDAVRPWPIAQRALPWVTAAAVLACAALARHQVGYWHDDLTLFGHTLSVTAPNPWAENSLGVAHDRAGRLAEAEVHFLEALRTYPQHYEAQGNLAVLLARRGDFAGAETRLKEALRLQPGFVGARLNLAYLRMLQGRPDDAASEYARAVEMQPRNALFRFRMAEALAAAGRRDEAISQLREVVRLDPSQEAPLAALRRLGASP